MNTQYEMAKISCQKWIPDEVIDKELASLSQEKWNEQCAILDEMMKEHVENCKNEEDQERVMLEDLINIGTANNVDEITVWVAYLKWLNVEYEILI